MSKEGCASCDSSGVPVCHVKLDSIVKLKNSTKKLLCLLEDIQVKTHSKGLPSDEPKKITSILQPLQLDEKPDPKHSSVTEIIGAEALRRLEDHTKDLDSIVIVDDDDDCSVYKRLTRKCHCLNQKDYNDFVIHFNEETKFSTNSFGELIKNMRILKKFLYIGGDYTKRALMFLNEGLSEAAHIEKVEMIQAIAFADVCNIFEEHSIVTICIIWPNKQGIIIEPIAQALTASLLYKIVQVEEGRRYFMFNSKIMMDIRRVLKKKYSNMDYDVLDCLKSVMALCQPSPEQQPNLTYSCRTTEEALGNRALNALNTYRHMMTMNEVFQYLDILHSQSNNYSGRLELTQCLPLMISLFKSMLLEYDNSGMNILITNILNNIVTKTDLKEPDVAGPKTLTVANTGTEPLRTRNVIIQIPVKKNTKKNNANKSKITLGTAHHKDNNGSKRKVHTKLDDADGNLKATVNDNTRNINRSARNINRSRKFSTKEEHNNHGVIVVPID